MIILYSEASHNSKAFGEGIHNFPKILVINTTYYYPFQTIIKSKRVGPTYSLSAPKEIENLTILFIF